MAQEAWVQVTAGQGPVECAWAVGQIVERFCAEAAEAGIAAHTLDVQPGPAAGTAESMLLRLTSAEPLDKFLRAWQGTVQWVARSPFRPAHPRKNWFVGIQVWQPVAATCLHLEDVRIETMRASGPGGQHVNRTESAVRVTHTRIGVQASASEERSQHRNRALALARLAQKLADRTAAQRQEADEQRWRAHQTVERGNPVRVFREKES